MSAPFSSRIWQDFHLPAQKNAEPLQSLPNAANQMSPPISVLIPSRALHCFVGVLCKHRPACLSVVSCKSTLLISNTGIFPSLSLSVKGKANEADICHISKVSPPPPPPQQRTGRVIFLLGGAWNLLAWGSLQGDRTRARASVGSRSTVVDIYFWIVQGPSCFILLLPEISHNDCACKRQNSQCR